MSDSNTYILWVGGCEIGTFFNLDDAEDARQSYVDQGYDDVQLEIVAKLQETNHEE